jgi:hypothetical protein
MAVHKRFDDHEHLHQPAHRKLNVVWIAKWKHVQKRWLHKRMQEESRRRLYSA